ncbi:MAG: protease inhibitor I42 family protein [Nitrospirota bacterium]
MTTTQQPAKIIDAVVGESFDVTVWEDRTAGYSWTPQYDSNALDLVDDDYQRTVNVDTADFGRRTFTFAAKIPGDYSLVLEYRVGWKFSATNRRQYLVTVHPSTTASSSH